MRLFLLTVCVLLAAVIQGSLLTPLHLPTGPQLPLLVALCGAWIVGAPGGAWLGFWTGILMASMTGMFMGSFTFSYLVVGWLTGRIRENLYGDWPLLFIAVAGAGTLFSEVLFFLWNPRHLGNAGLMVSQAVMNLVCAPLVYFPLAWALRSLAPPKR